MIPCLLYLPIGTPIGAPRLVLTGVVSSLVYVTVSEIVSGTLSYSSSIRELLIILRFGGSIEYTNRKKSNKKALVRRMVLKKRILIRRIILK